MLLSRWPSSQCGTRFAGDRHVPPSTRFGCQLKGTQGLDERPGTVEAEKRPQEVLVGLRTRPEQRRDTDAAFVGKKLIHGNLALNAVGKLLRVQFG